MTLKKKRLVANIIFYTLIVLIYGFVISMLITKFTTGGGTIYLFNIRYDVVLTGSMSQRNEYHLDFLEGTTQIQQYDVVRSRKIDDGTKLNVKDVVLFTNHYLGNITDMHRIVNITEKYDTLTVYNSEAAQIDDKKTIHLNDYSSYIRMTDTQVSKIELSVLSPNMYDYDYAFGFGGDYLESTFTSEKVGNYYVSTVTCLHNSSAAKPISIVKNNHNGSYIASVTFTTPNGNTYSFTGDDYTPVEGEPFEKHYNIRELYEVRGDKAKDSDGIFERSSIQSRVENILPKAGYVVRYLTSIPGILMFVGLGIIISVTSYFYNKSSIKKEKQSTQGTIEETVERKEDEGTNDQ